MTKPMLGYDKQTLKIDGSKNPMTSQLQPETIILKYLCEQLDQNQKAELQQLLGLKNTVSAEPDDLAEDALKGRIAMDRLPPRLHRLAMSRCAPDRAASAASFHERFPTANRLSSY